MLRINCQGSKGTKKWDATKFGWDSGLCAYYLNFFDCSGGKIFLLAMATAIIEDNGGSTRAVP